MLGKSAGNWGELADASSVVNYGSSLGPDMRSGGIFGSRLPESSANER